MCTIVLMNDLGLVRMHNLLEILIFTLRNFTKLPILRYLGIYNVLHIWHIRAIPTHYRVYTDSVIQSLLVGLMSIACLLPYKVRRGYSNSGIIAINCILNGCFSYNTGDNQTFTAQHRIGLAFGHAEHQL